MKLVVISPDHEHAREIDVLVKLFAAGLERYHVRKPDWPLAKLEQWLRAMPREWAPRLVLHHHHELVAKLGLGGRHWPDTDATASTRDRTALSSRTDTLTESRSCHTLDALRAAAGRYDYVFFGPVFPSLSKPGHAPSDTFSTKEISTWLQQRTKGQRRTAVLALSGVTAERLDEVRQLGFDGAAVVGAVWQSPDPVAAFRALQPDDSTNDLLIHHMLQMAQSTCLNPPTSPPL